MALQIPTLSDGTAYYRTRVTLDGQEYLIDFAWRDLYSVWELSLYSGEGALLCGPIRCYAGRPMLRYYHSDPRVPAGELVVNRLDTSRTDVPGLYDLGPGRDAVLTYYPVAE